MNDPQKNDRNNMNDPQKKYHLGTVSKNLFLETLLYKPSDFEIVRE